MADKVTFAPRTIHDASGKLEGIILGYGEYRELLSLLAQHVDWEELPEHLQDAIDNMLADEAESESPKLTSLSSIIADLNSH